MQRTRKSYVGNIILTLKSICNVLRNNQLTDGQSKDYGCSNILRVRSAEGKVEDGSGGNDKAEVVQKKRVDSRKVGHPATEHSAYSVGDTNDTQKERGFLLRNTLQTKTGMIISKQKRNKLIKHLHHLIMRVNNYYASST